jgi:hypothetical protein
MTHCSRDTLQAVLPGVFFLPLSEVRKFLSVLI